MGGPYGGLTPGPATRNTHSTPNPASYEAELLLGRFNLALTHRRTNAEYRLHFLFHFGEQYRIVLEVHLCILTTLSDALRAVAVPRSGLVDDPGFSSDVEH